ncbi:MAG: MBOAT family protein [Lachnospiraceae bacterium]|nr:MBOAT family protein [Lachnospiraceae bacterium]
MSFWFYGYFNLSYIFILLGSLLFNYSVYLCRNRAAGKIAKALTIFGVAGNLALLFYYKYMNFFVDNINAIFKTDIFIEKILLPLGISFFTFQQISFLIDTHKDGVRYKFTDYAFFITFFPQLVAGPIVTHDELIPQLEKKFSFSAENCFDGLARFTIGLSKKVLLADTLAVITNAEFNNIAYLDLPTAWLSGICYMLQLYFDFSGYSDMSVGLGKLLGFDLPENFNSPLTATSVKDFWRRWHITLSRFMGKYIYIPLGGSRCGKRKQCFNLFIVFLLSGIWHGAEWTFVVWGIIHGVFVIFETIRGRKLFKNDHLNRIITFIAVTFSFVIFRCENMSDALMMIQKMFAGGFHNRFTGMCNCLYISENYALLKANEILGLPFANLIFIVSFCLLMLISFLFIWRGPRAKDWIEKKALTTKGIVTLAALFTWSFISLSKVSEFLYFNF